jgi:hypothetical protein
VILGFSPRSLLARIGLFLACLPSGSAVLTEVYGVLSLRDCFWFLAVPGYLVLAATWWFGRNAREEWVRELSDAVAIGAVGGFLATVAYDVVRIPFVMSGIRVYVPNSTYGLWILDADFSTRLTETVGWFYHFANGTAFGIMYALFMRGRHWFFAVVWACLLETIAIFSPYAVVYQLAGKPYIIAIAYFGHVAYGLPLGFMVQRWAGSAAYLRNLPPIGRIALVAILLASVVGSLTYPRDIADPARKANAFVVEGGGLAPDWLRLRKAGPIFLKNGCGGPSTVVLNGAELPPLAPCEEREVAIAEPGIAQLYAKSASFRSHSSFVLVDPVAQARLRKP